MIQQTVFPFKLEITKERLTAHGGLALMAEFYHGIGLRRLRDKYLPAPKSNRGFRPSQFVSPLVLMLQGGGRSLKDIRELEQEEGLMGLIGDNKPPEPDTISPEAEKDAFEVLQWHNQMGQAEDLLKEIKIGFGMERMPCGQSKANAVFFRIGVIAYNLFIGFKSLSCPERWIKHTIETFR